ncbi:hypothetical protein F5Y11DRAFT_350189 [Daldinia sp. FL1419]|nr:hypothetical protein F5Y11DRAFT_350189 [Daldinia sp. FL1419]
MALHWEGDLNDSNTRNNWCQERRMGFYHNYNEKEANTKGSSNELIALLAQIADDVEVLDDRQSTTWILLQIALDSLVAIELHRWWKQVLGSRISVLEIMAIGTVLALGDITAEGLTEKFSGSDIPEEKAGRTNSSK